MTIPAAAEEFENQECCGIVKRWWLIIRSELAATSLVNIKFSEHTWQEPDLEKSDPILRPVSPFSKISLVITPGGNLSQYIR